MKIAAEHRRLDDYRHRKANWKKWRPYLSERSWGTVREDVKEYYFYLDSTPTHSYMKMLYKYPQAEYPYADLVFESRHRGFFDFDTIFAQRLAEADEFYDAIQTPGLSEDEKYVQRQALAGMLGRIK